MMETLPYRSVLVTGGGGFVGGWLLARLLPLLGSNARLFMLGRHSTAGPACSEPLVADLRDGDAVMRAVEMARPDLVIHLAAQSSVAQGNDGAGETWAVNVGGSLHLARACAAIGFAGTVLFASSAEVYGRSFNDGIVNESTVLLPQSAYARSKAAAEAMFADVLPAAARLIVVRPGNHSGAGQDERFVLPSFAAQIASIECEAGPPVLRVGNLDAERDFLDVRDVIEAYLALLAAAPRLPLRSVFNVASERPVPIAGLLRQLLALTSTTIELMQDSARLRPSDIARTAMSAAALRDATGWHPSRDTAKMVADILDAARRRHDAPNMR